MRSVCVILALFVTVSFSSCLLVGNAPVTGRRHDVSLTDIHAALAADKAPWDRGPHKTYEIEVVSADEMHLYRTPRDDYEVYDIMKHNKGHWAFETQGTVGKEPIP